MFVVGDCFKVGRSSAELEICFRQLLTRPDLDMGRPSVALRTSRWKWLSDRGNAYAACDSLVARKAFETTTFAEYLQVYPWSLPETEEPDPNKIYTEPAPGDLEGQRIKEDTIKKMRGVRHFDISIQIYTY
jgi:hypothetical protein